ncbi:hypothetical protein [Streptomyces sp. NPDC088350]
MRSDSDSDSDPHPDPDPDPDPGSLPRGRPCGSTGKSYGSTG